MPSLSQLGWSSFFSDQIDRLEPDTDLSAYRVSIQLRDRFGLLGVDGSTWAEARGRLYRDGELPAVGDWVLARHLSGDGDAVIEHLLERRSSLTRAAAGRRTESQVIAANIDVVFVVTSANADLNPRRLERYLTLVWDGGAKPVIVINKADLCASPDDLAGELGEIALAAPVVVTSAIEGLIEPLKAHLSPTTTAAFVGSSGVGKSTLVNALVGADVQATADIREDDARGRHTTTARELILVPEVAILIDTPGLRELGMWEGDAGIGATFHEIDELAAECRFRDCGHASEPGCAVLAAVARGEVTAERLAGYHKLNRELEHHDQRRTAASRTAGKRLGKMIKQAKVLKGQ